MFYKLLSSLAELTEGQDTELAGDGTSERLRRARARRRAFLVPSHVCSIEIGVVERHI